MKRSVFSIVIVFVVVLFSYSAIAQGNNKVEICHHPPGHPENVQTIWVSMNALQAHLAHGDAFGICSPELFYVDTDKFDISSNINEINVEYNLVRPSTIKVEVYDQLGNIIGTVEPEKKIVGKYTQVISSKDLSYPSGMCFVRVSISNKYGTITKPLMLI